MNIDQDCIINICYFAFILIIICFYINNIIKTIFDKVVSAIAIVLSLFILFSDEIVLLDLAHCLYFIYLILIACFSNNIYFLILNILMLINIVLTHLYYKKCILNNRQKNSGFFYNLINTINTNIGSINFFNMYIILLIISIIKSLFITIY